jgi:ribosomal protein S18 acetylase RimI-like enzyme
MVQHDVDGPSQLYIDNLGVSPMRRRRDIARVLVHEATAWSGELGCAEAWIVTDLDNHEANALCRSLKESRFRITLRIGLSDTPPPNISNTHTLSLTFLSLYR